MYDTSVLPKLVTYPWRRPWTFARSELERRHQMEPLKGPSLSFEGVDWLRYPVPKERPVMTIEEFIANESECEKRYEYLRGRIYSVPDKNDAYNTTRGNVFAVLKDAARGTDYRVYQADMALRVGDEAYFYPDVMLTNSGQDAASPLVKREPSLLVEILSSTEGLNIEAVRAKRSAARNLPSLRTQWLVDLNRRGVDVYQHVEGRWTHTHVRDGVLSVAGLPGVLAVERFFELV